MIKMRMGLMVKHLINSCQNIWVKNLFTYNKKFRIKFKFMNTDKIEDISFEKYETKDYKRRHIQEVLAWRIINGNKIEILLEDDNLY